jgi:hypothetical protein
MSRISEEARNCVVFVGYEAGNPSDAAEIVPIGTGFLIYSGEGGYRGVYLVTAAHVARKLGSDPFVVRQNDSAGTARLHHVDQASWFYHSDPGMDVAVMRYEGPDWVSAVTTLPVSEILDPSRAQHWDVGPGDVVYLIGLFYLHTGKRRNLPVVHTGRIALLPSDDKIPIGKDDDSRAIDQVSAYLVEMHALVGASGSPVMIRPTLRHITKDLRDGNESLALVEDRDFLLGVWIAAWPGKPDNIVSGVAGQGAMTWVPVGMGIVIPADRIIEILSRPELTAERQQAMTQDITAGCSDAPADEATAQPSQKGRGHEHGG